VFFGAGVFGSMERDRNTACTVANSRCCRFGLVLIGYLSRNVINHLQVSSAKSDLLTVLRGVNTIGEV